MDHQYNEEQDAMLFDDNAATCDDNAAKEVSTPCSPSSRVHPDTPQSILINTPGGSEQWIRNVEAEFLPTVGMIFSDLDMGIKFYETYALACGFETRKSTTKRDRDKVITSKLVVCNRQGFKEIKPLKPPPSPKADETEATPETHRKRMSPRKHRIVRFGCKAMIRFSFEYSDKTYKVSHFHQFHNHRLCSVKNREFLKLARNMTLYHKQIIVNHSRLNIGPTKSFRICKEYANGYENVGATLTDFKNYGKDIKCFIGEKDAQMFVNNLETQSEINPGFYHAYEVDKEGCLCRLFWTDATSRKNYALFGDTISFDPTYGTNKYNMIFTPFTGVDHHKKSVTFGAALVSKEDENTFVWVFKKFLDAMGNKEPQCFITDQCPAMKNAVPRVFKTARHRYCMWHITEKFKEKAGSTTYNNTDFLPRINSAVWDMDLEPLEFEEKWLKVVDDYEFHDPDWFQYMFSIKHKWIPAYFKDWHLGCILRTTQRSESENSFFKKNQNNKGTLVEFWMRYKTAIEHQRYGHKCLINITDSSLPQNVTPLYIELHAAKIYTHAVFSDFQEQVKCSLTDCSVAGFSKTNNADITQVNDAEKHRVFEVIYDNITKEASCSCKLFESKGMLCKHIIWVYSGKRVTAIPDRYIISRWTRDAHRKPVYDTSGNLLKDADVTDARQKEITKVWSQVYGIMADLGSKEEKEIKAFCSLLTKFRADLNGGESVPLTKEKELESLLGCSASIEVTVRPPKVTSNKGSGKRLLSKKEVAMKAIKKVLRFCANCGKKANHDKRNCPHPPVTEISQTQELVKEVAEKTRRHCANCGRFDFHDKRTCTYPKVFDGDACSADSCMSETIGSGTEKSESWCRTTSIFSEENLYSL